MTCFQSNDILAILYGINITIANSEQVDDRKNDPGTSICVASRPAKANSTKCKMARLPHNP